MSCSEEKEHVAPAIYDKDSVSVMTSYGVNTLISDSGIIKYRIVAERWDVNQIKKPSRWTFIKGVFFEQFDEKFHVQAYIQADTAWYYDQIKLWELRGRVRVRNVNGMRFEVRNFFGMVLHMNFIRINFRVWLLRNEHCKEHISGVMRI